MKLKSLNLIKEIKTTQFEGNSKSKTTNEWLLVHYFYYVYCKHATIYFKSLITFSKHIRPQK